MNLDIIYQSAMLASGENDWVCVVVGVVLLIILIAGFTKSGRGGGSFIFFGVSCGGGDGGGSSCGDGGGGCGGGCGGG